MCKFILTIIGIASALCIIAQIAGVEIDNPNPITENIPWILLVMCAGFHGIINAIEKNNKKEKQNNKG